MATGVKKDARDFYDFLRSDYGGAWEDDEIDRYDVFQPDSHNLTEEQIIDCVYANSDAEYMMYVFSGHGFETPEGERYVELSVGNDISIDKLHRMLCQKKHTIITDACRGIYSLGEGGRLPSARCFSQPQKSEYRKVCREYYDGLTRQAPAGAYSIGMAVSSGESAQDNGRRGGEFSQALLAHCKWWAKTTQTSNTINGTASYSRSLVEAICSICDKVATDTGGRQNPECECNEGVQLPFVVCPPWTWQDLGE